MKKCLQCEGEHDKKGIYCDKKCADKAYRERKKNNEVTVKVTTKSVVARKIRIEGGENHKWCNYCGVVINENKDTPGFCSELHWESYSDTIGREGTLTITINDRTKVLTKKYDKVQEIISSRLKPVNLFF